MNCGFLHADGRGEKDARIHAEQIARKYLWRKNLKEESRLKALPNIGELYYAKQEGKHSSAHYK